MAAVKVIIVVLGEMNSKRDAEHLQKKKTRDTGSMN